jgi:hypothetical protein
MISLSHKIWIHKNKFISLPVTTCLILQELAMPIHMLVWTRKEIQYIPDSTWCVNHATCQYMECVNHATCQYMARHWQFDSNLLLPAKHIILRGQQDSSETEFPNLHLSHTSAIQIQLIFCHYITDLLSKLLQTCIVTADWTIKQGRKYDNLSLRPRIR